MDLIEWRWQRIAEVVDPDMPPQIPGLPPTDQLVAELRAAMLGAAEPASPGTTLDAVSGT